MRGSIPRPAEAKKMENWIDDEQIDSGALLGWINGEPYRFEQYEAPALVAFAREVLLE